MIIGILIIVALVAWLVKRSIGKKIKVQKEITGPESNKEKEKPKNQPDKDEQGESNENLEPKQSFCISSTPGEIGVGTVFKALGVSCCLGAKCVGEKISNGNKSGKAKIKDNNGKERSKLLTGNSY